MNAHRTRNRPAGRALIGMGLLICLPLAPAGLAHPGHDDLIIPLRPLAPDTVLLAAASGPGYPPRPTATAVPAGSTPLRNEVSITTQEGYRIIRANGVPDHTPGQFPNRGNPHRIAAQQYQFRVPAQPRIAPQATPLAMQPFGVAVNGVVFDPGAAEWWQGDRRWQYEPMSGAINLGVDDHNAHVQPNGAYHYHAIPSGLLQRLTGGQPKMVLLGWAADGFPIYGPWAHTDPKDAQSPLKKMKSGYRVKSGDRPGGPGGAHDGSFLADYAWAAGVGDLDECNGRTGVTPEFPQGTYYYVLTETYPYIPRQFKGTPDNSFARRGPPRGPGGPGGPPGGGRGPGGFGPPGPRGGPPPPP